MPSNPSRRLEDRIRELALQLANAQPLDLPKAITHLQMALNEFAQLQIAIVEYKLRFGNKTSKAILAWPDFPRDRRSSTSGTQDAGGKHERKKEAQKNARHCG
jgi:hypothetical protein